VQQAAGESKRRSEELGKRLSESTGGTQRVRTKRARLKSDLGGQLKAVKAAAAKAKTACREEARRSKRLEQELSNLQQQRGELSGKLAAAQQAAGESKRRTEELEKRLGERNQQLEHAKTGLEQHAADRARLESELGEQLEVAKAAVQRAEAVCRKKPSGS